MVGLAVVGELALEQRDVLAEDERARLRGSQQGALELSPERAVLATEVDERDQAQTSSASIGCAARSASER